MDKKIFKRIACSHFKEGGVLIHTNMSVIQKYLNVFITAVVIYIYVSACMYVNIRSLEKYTSTGWVDKNKESQSETVREFHLFKFIHNYLPIILGFLNSKN